MRDRRSLLRRPHVLALGAALLVVACQSPGAPGAAGVPLRVVPNWPFASSAGAPPGGDARRGGGASGDRLMVYTSWSQDALTTVSLGYTRRTGVPVAGISIPTGETAARLRAESVDPQADVWFSARIAILADALANAPPLIEDYKPPNWDQVLDIYQFRNTGFAVGVGTYPLVIYYNARQLAELNLPVPTSYEDLADPRYRGRIVMPNPASTGTGYSAVTTVLQIMGEEQGWDYLARLAANVDRFTPGSDTPPMMVVQGLYPIGLGFYDRAYQLRQEGYQVQLAYPEPVFASPWGVGMVRGAKHADRAREYYAYLLTPEAQKALTTLGNYSVRPDVAPPADGRPLSELRILDYDWAYWAQQRGAVLDRFNTLARTSRSTR